MGKGRGDNKRESRAFGGQHAEVMEERAPGILALKEAHGEDAETM
jgi:hypothetical protein